MFDTQSSSGTPGLFLVNPWNEAVATGMRRFRMPVLRLLAFVPIVAFLVYVGWRLPGGWKDWIELKSDLRRAEGHVTELRVEEVSGRSGQRGTRINWVHYEFLTEEAAGSGRNPGVAPESAARFQSLKVGSAVEVYYAAANPQNSALYLEGMPLRLLVETVMFSLVLLFGLALLPGTLRLWRRHRKLARDGRILKGQVLTASRVRSQRSVYLNVSYEFISPEGKRLVSVYQGLGKELYSKDTLPILGTPVAVLYADRETFQLL